MNPSDNEIRALIVPNDDPHVCGFSSFLNKQQRARCRRYQREEDRHAAMVCKGLWRLGAGVLLDRAPHSVQIDRDQWKRPTIYDVPREGLDLNVSRTPKHCALVISRGIRVGIDIEVVTGELVTKSIVNMVTHESEDPSLVMGNPDLFFQFWTQNEAVLKADGRGLHIDPRSVVGAQKPSSLGTWSLCGCGDAAWYTTMLDCSEGLKGAVAAERAPSSYEQISWDHLITQCHTRGSCACSHTMNP
jgi:4'-phosphopantetheinyl transferase